MAGPSWLLLALRLNTKPTSFVRGMLTSTELATQTVANDRGKGRRIVAGVKKLLTAAVGGTYDANMYMGIINEGTLPAGNIACVQSTSAGSTVTFTYGDKTVVLTEGAAGANGFARGASNTTEAAALAACINAHPILGALYTALGSSGNCGLTGKIPGGMLNRVVITAGTGFTVTALSVGTNTAEAFLNSIWMNRNV
jgi:hypothetical protein